MEANGAELTKAQEGTNHRNRKIAKNAVSGVAVQGLYLISRLAITPFILLHITLEEYGLWSICFVILSYAGLGLFGFNNAYVKYTAEYYEQGKINEINRLLNSGILFMVVLCICLFSVLMLFLPLFLKYFSIAADLKSTAAFLITGTGMIFFLEISLGGGFKGIIEGLQEIFVERSIWFSASIIELVLIVLLLINGFGVMGLLYAYGVRILFLIIAYGVVVKKKFPELTLRVGHFDWKLLKSFFSFGGKLQVVGIIGTFFMSVDRLSAIFFIGPEATAYLELGRKLPFAGRLVSHSAFQALMPAASAMGSGWRRDADNQQRKKILFYIRLFCISAFLGALVITPFLWLQWKSGNYDLTSYPVYLIAGITILFLYPCIGLIRRSAAELKLAPLINHAEIHHLYLESTRHINLFVLTLFIFLVAASKQLVFAWLGGGYEIAIVLLEIYSIATMIHLVMGTGASVLKGMNCIGNIFEPQVIQLALISIWLPFFTPKYGIVGIAIVILAARCIGTLYFVWVTNRIFGISFIRFAKKAIVPGIAPAVAGFAVWSVLNSLPKFSRWGTLIEIVISGLAYLFITGFLVKTYFLSPQEVERLLLPLKRILGFPKTEMT